MVLARPPQSAPDFKGNAQEGGDCSHELRPASSGLVDSLGQDQRKFLILNSMYLKRVTNRGILHRLKQVVGDSGIGVPCLQTKARKYALCAANTLQIDGHRRFIQGWQHIPRRATPGWRGEGCFSGGPMATLGDIDKG